MNKLFKRAVSFAAIAVMVFAFNIVAMAQGTTTINVSKSSASVGDSITVSISATESGTITVKYTASMLSLSSCSVSGYTSEGNAVSFSGKQGDIVFSAAAEGTASIIVSSSANSGSSTTLTIGGSSSSSSTSTESEASTEETAEAEVTTEESTETTEETTEETTTATTATTTTGVGTLNSDGGFDIDGVSYVVSERFSDSDMPTGFSKTTVTIGSSTYSEPTNGSLTLLYLKPADNTSGSGVFYLYNAEAGTVSPFLMLGTADSYVIVSDNGSAPTSAFTATTLDVNGGTATAYTIDGAEFFYVYGSNQDGATGWFVYDSTYQTVSRVDESALSASTTTDTTEEVDETETTTDNNLYVEKLNLYRKIIMGLIVLCVVLLFIIINKAIRGHGEDDDFNGDVFAKAPTKSSRRLPRSIVFGGKERDDDDDDDEYDEDEEYYDEDEEEYDDFDEDEDDDDRDFSKSRFESESYEARRASSLNMMDLNDL